MSSPSDQLLRSAEFRKAGYWSDDTFPAVIDRWADQDPRHPYLSDGTSALTYGQFREQAWNLAANLAGRGIRRGDRVAVQLPNWNEFFLVYAACARLGAVVIPVVTVYRAGEVSFIVANSGAAAFITCGEFRGFDHAAMAAEITASAPHPVAQIVVRADPPPGALALAGLPPAQPSPPLWSPRPRPASADAGWSVPTAPAR
jgi:non-ribosomal peptide synthetase component E (peptide arylation enzyme)